MERSARHIVEQIALDAAHASALLGALTRRDELTMITRMLERGRLQYAELVHRRQLLRLAPEDARAIDDLLDNVKAHIKFVECLCRSRAGHRRETLVTSSRSDMPQSQ